jgi:hypothetical protein
MASAHRVGEQVWLPFRRSISQKTSRSCFDNIHTLAGRFLHRKWEIVFRFLSSPLRPIKTVNVYLWRFAFPPTHAMLAVQDVRE